MAAFMQIIGRCLKSVVILFCRHIIFGVSGDVGCLHMSIGLKIESPLAELWSYACVIAYE